MHFFRQYFIPFLCGLLLTGQAYADIEQHRINFKKTLKQVSKLHPPAFSQAVSTFDTYPLKSYLHYRLISKNISTTSTQEIQQFIKRNEHSFYAHRLRNQWLNHLAKTRQWSSYLKAYELDQSASRQCQRLNALINTGKYKQALKETPKLWLVGKSQHKHCDPAFAFFEKQGKLTDNLRWQRLQLSLEQRQFSLATYLAKSVKDKNLAKKWVSQWQRMHSKPLQQLQRLTTNQPLKLHKAIDSKEAHAILIAHGIKRLARKSTEQAFQQWQRIKPRYTFSQAQQDQIQASIGTRAALNRQDKTLGYYGDVPHQHWRARAALWQQDWPAVQKAIHSLDKKEQQTSRWQYWLARSYSALRQQHKADVIYHKLILQRDYYGFLAADKLGKPYQLNHDDLNFNKQHLAEFSKQPAIEELHEFYVIGLGKQARQQAYFLKQSLTKRELEMLAALTHQWGWHNQTIALLGKAKSWNDLNLRFPIVYNDYMNKAGKTTALDPSWLLGVARQESAFNPQARSHVGARGLMQLMPKTAKAIAKTIKAPLKRLTELNSPSRNIQLGSAYLRQVYDKNQQNPVLATASYNAGPHRVARWLPKTALPADIWIENIPFNETRKYTANVISYAAIFDHQRQQSITRLSQRMPIIQPKNSQ